MPNILLLATAWGPKHGGINAFNMDFAAGLAGYVKPSGSVFCAVLDASREDCERALALDVTLVPIGKDIETPSYDEAWAHTVRERLPPETAIDWWVGHDVTSAAAALKGPQVTGGGRSAVIMHMNYAAYESYKHSSSAEAVRKEGRQRELFKRADKHFAVGPLLRNAMRDMVEPEVTMLVPGFAEIHGRPATHALTLVTFGRMDRESDRIKQGGLAVAGFASAVRSAHQPGMPRILRENPQMRVIGISEEKDAEEAALRRFANYKAGREINLLAQPFDEDRAALFDQLQRANIALMLSWHEGFGLTGWEAIAAEVPLIVSRQSGLYRLVDEALGDPGTACFRTIDVQGRGGDDDTSNFTEPDEEDTRDAILSMSSDLPRAQHNARLLKKLLQDKLVCTWENTARQFCKRLGLEPHQASMTDRKPLESRGRPQFEAPADKKQDEPGIARIGAIMRRPKIHSESIIRIGKLTINLDTRSVDVEGRRLHVTGKEYRILELLSLRKGATLSKEMFMDHLYGGIDEPELKLIDVFICKLRKKLAVATGGQHYIETVWGKGYRLRDSNESVTRSENLEDLNKHYEGKIISILDAVNRRVSTRHTTQYKPQQRRIFLAHAREDKQRIRALYAALKADGFNPWVDEVDLLPGQNWKLEIQRAIRDAGVFLACLSSHSVTKEGYVQTEFRTALGAYSERPPDTIYIIPAKLDDCEIPDLQIPDRGITLRDIHWVELWQDTGFEQLRKAIRHALGTEGSGQERRDL